MRYLFIGAAIALAAFLHTSYALAFSSREAGLVVNVLDELAASRGESVYYDAEAADDWFDYDSEDGNLITAAGFTKPSWRDAYDKTLKGMIALVPRKELEEMSSGLAASVASLTQLSDAQRAEVLADMREASDDLTALAEEGRAYADAVAPYAARLRELAGF